MGIYSPPAATRSGNSSRGQLGQARPTTTEAESIYSPSAGYCAEVSSLAICNNSDQAAEYSLFHDNDGAVFSEETALFFEIELPAKTTVWLVDIKILMGNASGNLGVKSSVSQAITFTAYGEESY